MIKLTEQEMQRALRRNLEPNQAQIADALRQICRLDEQQWPPERLLAHTRRGLDRAIGWNLTTGQDIMSFLALRHQFGERFDEFPAVRKFLSRTDLPVDNRIPLMMLELPLAIWDVVRRRTPAGPSPSTHQERGA